jgi:hypothetical protein
VHPFDELLQLIRCNNPYKFMLTFDTDSIELEHFDDDYLGDLESGSGDWIISGDVSSIVEGTLQRVVCKPPPRC